MVKSAFLTSGRSCGGPDYWVSYSQFHYGRRQVRWVFENEEDFAAGCWPREPSGEYLTERFDRHERTWVEWVGCGGGAAERQGKAPAASEASYCKTMEIYSDILSRIKKTGTDGKLLLAELRAGNECLDKEAQNALDYASGYKQKETSYQDWLRVRERRRGGRIRC